MFLNRMANYLLAQGFSELLNIPNLLTLSPAFRIIDDLSVWGGEECVERNVVSGEG